MASPGNKDAAISSARQPGQRWESERWLGHHFGRIRPWRSTGRSCVSFCLSIFICSII